jgi:hypothetical protein
MADTKRFECMQIMVMRTSEVDAIHEKDANVEHSGD